MKRKILFYVLGVTVVLIVTLFGFAERKLPLIPEIDTVFAEGFSERAFADVAIGTPADEVEQKLGKPLWKIGCGQCWEPEITAKNGINYQVHEQQNCNAQCLAPVQNWQYSDDGASPFWDFAWREISVVIEDNKVKALVDEWRFN